MARQELDRASLYNAFKELCCKGSQRNGMQYMERKLDHEKFCGRQETLQQVCTLLGMIQRKRGKSYTAGERERLECFPQQERGQGSRHGIRPGLSREHGQLMPCQGRKAEHMDAEAAQTVDVVVEVLSLIILLLLCLSDVGRKVSGKSENEEETVMRGEVMV